MRIRVITVALILMLINIGVVLAEVDDYAIAMIQSEIDHAYNEKIQSGEFESYVINGLNMEEDPFLANYFVGDFGGRLIRPIFFAVAHLHTEQDVMPADINFIALYLEGILRSKMEDEGKDYLNMQMLREHWDRIGLKNTYPQLVTPSQVYAMSRDIVDIVIFGLNDFLTSNMDIDEQYVNNELYAMIRMCMKGEETLMDACYVITDQKKVHDIIVAMDIVEEINDAAKKCLEQMD